MKIVGLIDKEDKEIILFMAKLLLTGNRARELSKEARQTANLIDDTINMYQPKRGEK